MRLNACENLYKNALVFSASYSDNDEMSDFLQANIMAEEKNLWNTDIVTYYNQRKRVSPRTVHLTETKEKYIDEWTPLPVYETLNAISWGSISDDKRQHQAGLEYQLSKKHRPSVSKRFY